MTNESNDTSSDTSQEENKETKPNAEEQVKSSPTINPPLVPPGTSLAPVQTLPIQVIESLAKADPDQLLKFLSEYHQREIALRKEKEQLQHDLSKRKQEYTAQADKESRNVIRTGITAFYALFVAVLIYAGFTGDKELPDRVITLMSGVLAGGGGAVVISKNRSKQKQNDTDND